MFVWLDYVKGLLEGRYGWGSYGKFLGDMEIKKSCKMSCKIEDSCYVSNI